MASIGEQLRTAREARGYSIQDVEKATRIRRVFILALEEDRLEDLPDPAYARGFVGNYARYVGLAPEPLVAEYVRQAGARDLVVPTVLDEPLFSRARKGIKIGLWILLVAILVAVAGWLVYSLVYLRTVPWPLNQIEWSVLEPATPTVGPTLATMAPTPTATPLPTLADTATPSPSPTLNPTVAPTNSPVPNSTPTLGATSATNLTPTPTPLTDLPPAEGLPRVEGITVEVTATDYTWLQVLVDDQQALLGYLNDGDERAWTGDQSVELRVGNAAALSVQVDGQDVGPLGGANEVVTLRYTAGASR